VSIYFIVVTNKNNTHSSSNSILLLAALATRAKPVPAPKRVPCFLLEIKKMVGEWTGNIRICKWNRTSYQNSCCLGPLNATGTPLYL